MTRPLCRGLVAHAHPGLPLPDTGIAGTARRCPTQAPSTASGQGATIEQGPAGVCRVVCSVRVPEFSQSLCMAADGADGADVHHRLQARVVKDSGVVGGKGGLYSVT